MENKRITIYGLGAIGSNLLVQLAKQYPTFEYYGVDFDTVEERNVRTQAYFLEHIGLAKADAMRVVLARYLRKPRYIPVKAKIEAPVYGGVHGKEGPDHHLLVDCFDNSKSRRLFQNSGHILHLGFSPEYTAEILWQNDHYTVAGDVDPTKNDICTMTDAVGFINFVVSAAVLNISNWVSNGQKQDFMVKGKNKLVCLA